MSPQESIAHYRIVSKLGEGGMGAVYRATDTKLNRDVAIKVLPEALAGDEQYMARFQREAQTLASLNHPNIAGIYGIEQGAIVMELVEGEAPRGPLPVEIVITYARQIAAALEAAHEKGVIHRDLKPANIKVTPDGAVKLLDFGLAKTPELPASNPTTCPTLSPTLSLAMTQTGVILGTAAYMAPEQARGYAVDKRADIWAFGVVIFEMLTGTTLFQGDTVSDTLAAVLRADIDLERLPADTPQAVRRLLRRCLERDRKHRLPDIAMVRLELDEPPEKAAPPALPQRATPRSARLAWVVAGSFLAALVALGAVNWLRPKPPDPVAVRFALPWPEGTQEVRSAATEATASPDGHNLCMIAKGSDGARALWVRPLDEPLAHRLDKTEEASDPFWSPDGQFIAYFAGDKLRKIPVGGGLPQTICDAPHSSTALETEGSGAWSVSGTIAFSTGADSPIMRVPATGGPATPITKLDTAAGETRHSFPQFLPDGDHLLYFAANVEQAKGAVYVQDLGSPHRQFVMRSSLRAAWAPPGYLLFPKVKTLYAQRIDPKSFQLTGDPVSIAENLLAHDPTGTAGFDISGGILIYRTFDPAALAQLAWYGRDGKRQEAVGKPTAYTSVRMGLDDRIAVVSIGLQGSADTWTIDLATGGLRRATSNRSTSFVLGPLSPDSRRLAVNLIDSQGILEASATGGSTRVLGPAPLYADDWSPDGRFLFCRDVNGDHWTLLRTDGSGQLQPVGNGARGMQIRFAPDGRSVAYVSSVSGRGEVVVASFPSFAEKHQVSIDGGVHPAWRKDGKELLFQSLDGMVMSAEMRVSGGAIESGIPKPLFPERYKHGAGSGSFGYWAAPDGKRFLTLERDTRRGGTIVVLNWAAALKR
ncbi:MAG TPA: protein kinase [Bryobacteraceae bacterium]|nr:protein kinase [Bryobacteraceae bacterium]